MNFANLGIAMGAGVDEYHRQLDSNLKQTQEARAAEQFEWQKTQQERQRRIQGEQDALMKEFADLDNYYKGAAGIADDQLGEYIKSGMDKYNNHPLYKNGMFANVTNVDGRPMIVHGNMAKLGGVQMMPVDRKTLDEGYNHMRGMLMERLAATDPALYQQRFDKDRDFGQKGREIAVKERGNEIEYEFKRPGGTYHTIHQEDNVSKERVSAANNAASIKAHQISAGPGYARVNMERELIQNNRAVAQKYAPLFEQAQLALDNAYSSKDQNLIRAAEQNANMLQMRMRNEIESKNPSGQGLQLRMQSQSGGGGGKLSEMTPADAASLDAQIAERASLKAKVDPNYAKLLKQDPVAAKNTAANELAAEYAQRGVFIKGLRPPEAGAAAQRSMQIYGPAGGQGVQPPLVAIPMRDPSLDFMAGQGGMRFGSNGLPVADTARTVEDPYVAMLREAVAGRQAASPFTADVSYGTMNPNLGIPRNLR